MKREDPPLDTRMQRKSASTDRCEPATRRAPGPAPLVGWAAALFTSPRQRAQREQMRTSFGPAAQLKRAIAEADYAPGDAPRGDNGQVGFHASEAFYDQSLQKGHALWQQVQAWQQDRQQGQKSSSRSTLELFFKGYKHGATVDPDDGQGRSVNLASGRGGSASVWESAPYHNTYREGTGTFEAVHNKKPEDRDRKILPREPASNSEIIFKQYLLAARALGLQVSGNLRTLARVGIVNGQTNHTILWCDHGGEEGEKTAQPDSEDFEALLGTPNGNSAAYMLLQHGLALGLAGVEAIRYALPPGGGDGHLWIDFQMAPGAAGVPKVVGDVPVMMKASAASRSGPPGESGKEAGGTSAALARHSVSGHLPEALREGIRQLAGMDLADVRVHHDSVEPARLGAHAFAQGRDIHLAPGQELHLPHEAWHVVQQAQGRVRPTARTAGGVPVNDDPALEREADALGGQAAQLRGVASGGAPTGTLTVQRMHVVAAQGNDEIVEFDADEQLPSPAGNLASDRTHVYRLRADLGERHYQRILKGGMPPRVLGAQEQEQHRIALQRQQLMAPKSTLFGPADGGAAEGSFEYVANYLYSEVFGADADKARDIWGRIWRVVDVPNGDPVLQRVPGLDQKALLDEMIAIGLDASWRAVPVQDLVKTDVQGVKPARNMPVVTSQVFDYFSSLCNWTPWPETSGVGFHTTDGAPEAVATSTADGGWGGLQATEKVGFFRNRYGLDQAWNPLGPWLETHGPTFRKGVKDNELLSTVSVATAIHGSIRFPLADTPGRLGQHGVNYKGESTFKMEAYTYAVRVGSGYATFAKQGPNAFGEIATAGVPIEDIIGWSKVTRWHRYNQPAPPRLPLTADFWFQMTGLQRNPRFPMGGIYDRIFTAAQGPVNQEIALTGAPYQA